METVAILGGGNGGFAAAAHLTTMGYRVHLYNRSAKTIKGIQERGGVRYEGVLGSDFAPVPVITSRLDEALEGADLLMSCLPAVALEELAKGLAPLIDRPIPILLNPGSTGGALGLRRELQIDGHRSTRVHKRFTSVDCIDDVRSISWPACPANAAGSRTARTRVDARSQAPP